MHQPINDPSLKSSGNFGTGFIAIRAKQLLTANINRALVTCFSSCLERCHWEGKINICRPLALSTQANIDLLPGLKFSGVSARVIANGVIEGCMNISEMHLNN